MNRWDDLLRLKSEHGGEMWVAHGHRLRDGQWRMKIRLLATRTSHRRRRIVRVATLKYRARKRRR